MTIPIRSCAGCRGRDVKAELIRMVAVDGLVLVDVRQRLPGRGAYLHPTRECLDRALKRRSIGRALRADLDARQVEEALAPVSAVTA